MKKVLATLAIMGCAATANAATYSVSFTNPMATTDIAQTGTLQKFDSNLGNLTGASLTFTEAMNTSYSFTNLAAQAQTFFFSFNLNFLFSSTLAALNNIVSTVPPSVLSTPQTTVVGLGSGATSGIYGPYAPSSTTSFNLSTILSSLSAPGGGAFDTGCMTLSGTTFTGGGGNIRANQNTTAQCLGTITYQYTPRTPGVPAPASLALLGLGALGLALTKRRQKA